MEPNRVSTNQSPFVSSINPLVLTGQVSFGALRKQEEKAQARGPDFSENLTTDGECHETGNERNQDVRPLFPHCDRIPNRRNVEGDLSFYSSSWRGRHGWKRRSAHPPASTTLRWLVTSGKQTGSGKTVWKQSMAGSRDGFRFFPAPLPERDYFQQEPNSERFCNIPQAVPPGGDRVLQGTFCLQTTACGNGHQGYYALWPMQGASLRR